MEETKPWETEEGKQVWKTKSQYFVWLKGALRKLWSDYPVRQVWKKEQLRPVTDEEKLSKKYHPSTKNVGQCVQCKEWMAGSKLECDHKESSNGCSSWEDVDSFLRYCGATLPDDWVLMCKPCHKIKTYAERMGISFEEATIMKQVIALMKDKKKVDKTLAEFGLPCNNDKTRKQSLEQLIREDKL